MVGINVSVCWASKKKIKSKIMKKCLMLMLLLVCFQNLALAGGRYLIKVEVVSDFYGKDGWSNQDGKLIYHMKNRQKYPVFYDNGVNDYTEKPSFKQIPIEDNWDQIFCDNRVTSYLLPGETMKLSFMGEVFWILNGKESRINLQMYGKEQKIFFKPLVSWKITQVLKETLQN